MFKTILVHVDGGAHQESRLRAAVLSRAGYAVLNGSMAMPVSHREFQNLRDGASAALDVFREQAARLGAPEPETRLVEDSAPGRLLLQSRHADLVMLSQDDRAHALTDALIEMARDCHAGLLVAGAFGHSRYREWVLGGVTRDMFDHAPAPLLTMH